MKKFIIASLVGVTAFAGALVPATAHAQLEDIADTRSLCDSNFLPGGVGGYSISVGGRTVRVPKVKDINVCVTQNGIAIHPDVYQPNAGCGSTCFDVFGPISAYYPEVIARVCYTNDGARECVDGSHSYWVDVPRTCVLSVGKPAQQSPSTCLVVISEDPFLIPGIGT